MGGHEGWSWVGSRVHGLGARGKWNRHEGWSWVVAECMGWGLGVSGIVMRGRAGWDQSARVGS